jgi:O-acetyl-ADP-ribose deacetylase (regulator of RNase III)
MITIKKGNIFTTECQTIVNTVNCVGVMGAGIAYEFMLRYPAMFEKYQAFCRDGLIDIGSLWVYKHDTSEQAEQQAVTRVLNFPTKRHWKDPSKIAYLEAGLSKFISTYQQKGITSVAFPLLGASKGGLNESSVLAIMQQYLAACDIPIEIWYFDPQAKDDLYERFKASFSAIDAITIKARTGLRADKITKVKDALAQPQINSLTGLAQVRGIGKGTLEKAFSFMHNSKQTEMPETKDMFAD